ncbi:MAG TPA: RES family NAD+ phosphorylase [Solirubrobacteraceae bacterium]|nr:RES family NAD+ phosphorylase [Solirubrobacteraceae bacterium]
MEVVTFRLANYETPLWSVENFAAGRYNRAGSGVTQYLSLHPLTPWAELLRNEDRRTRDRAVLMRYPLWAIRAQLADEPRRLTFDTASQFGLDPGDLVADDFSRCQSLADTLRSSGTRAFTAPSAALPGTTNLVVLEPRVLVSYNQVPLDELDWPGSVTAQDGRCPDGLWELVHYRAAAARHRGLEAWERGETLPFREPEVTAGALAG